eukprot:TRINITY_DN26894_c0_g1_i1.p1 TRINITY_DN26894_c0_g1~~TRINITY_DN26894_c0_g1_i1.p1  ORF type:complete len:284 (+),score=43.32 TRINITY_DN26894_c0_g1_i1:61-912(+)
MFSILQWNVLADGLEYRHIPRWGNALKEGTRGSKVMAMVATFNADLICAQEVNQFQNMQDYFATNNHNYDGRFLPKPTGRGSSPDGAAIFWNKSKFTFIDALELKNLNGWNQVCLVVILKSLESGIVLSVASTHLKAISYPKEEKLRVQQALQFTALIENWIKAFSVDLNLFVGDMNSSPSSIQESWMGQVPKKLEEQGFCSCYHSFAWPDVKGVPMNRGDMITFCDGGEEALYDYIFYKTYNNAQVIVEYCEPVFMRKRAKCVADAYPSDHLPIFVKLCVKK